MIGSVRYNTVEVLSVAEVVSESKLIVEYPLYGQVRAWSSQANFEPKPAGWAFETIEEIASDQVRHYNVVYMQHVLRSLRCIQEVAVRFERKLAEEAREQELCNAPAPKTNQQRKKAAARAAAKMRRDLPKALPQDQKKNKKNR